MGTKIDSGVEFRVRLHHAGSVRTQQAGVFGDTLAVVGEWVIGVGHLAELRDRFPGADVVDHGADVTICPGFYDVHMHPAMAATDACNVDVSPDAVLTVGDLETTLRDAADRLGPGKWVRASRYDHAKTTGGKVIDRAFLDRVCPDNPTIVAHIAGHWSVANSLALQAGGHDRDSTAPSGGKLGRDASGELNGLLVEQCNADYLYPFLANGPTVVPLPSLDDRVAALGSVLGGMHAAGLTSVYDCWNDPSSIEMFEEARTRGDLTMRIGLLVSYKFWDQVQALKIRQGFGSTRLLFGGIKVMTDGAVGGATCSLKDPYEGKPDDRGVQVLDPDELYDITKPIHSAGVRLAIHANGDRAIEMTLDCFERLQREDPRPNLGHRIEHCSVVSEGIIERIAALGLGVAPFGNYISFHGEALEQWYGDRINRMFTHRWFLDHDIPVGGASDFTCSPYEPLLGIQSCVTRQSRGGKVLGPEQKVSAEEAMWIYTVGSARVAGEDHIKGRLAPGYLADFVCLEADPVKVNPQDISGIGVRSTWVGGEQVYAAEGA